MALRFPLWLAILAALACAGAPPAPAPQPQGASAVPLTELAGHRAAFYLTWNGARVGDARESLRRTSDGLRFERAERIRVRRAGALVALATDIEIRLRLDGAGMAEAIEVRARSTEAGLVTESHARRGRDGWRIVVADEPVRTAPGEAIPVELIPLLVAASPQRRFAGPVLLSGRGMALADAQVAPIPGQRRAVRTRIVTALGPLDSDSVLTVAGTIARTTSASGTGALRVAESELARAFEAPELIATTTIPVRGRVPSTGPVVLALEGARGALPPALPGQQIARSPTGWRVTLTGSGADADALDHLRVLARRTAALLVDDPAATPTRASAALALGRGDCTAHAALFVALAQARGFEARLVTGYRLDGAVLVRHRWAVAAVDGAWVTIDPTHGEVPAPPRLLGLAVHDARAAALSVVDDLAFAGTTGAIAHIARR